MYFRDVGFQRRLIDETSSTIPAYAAYLPRVHFQMRPKVAGPSKLPLTDAASVTPFPKVLSLMQLYHPFDSSLVITHITLISHIGMQGLHVEDHSPFGSTNLRTVLALDSILFYVMDLAHMDFHLIVTLE